MSWLDTFRAYPVRKTGIVNLMSGTSFRGVIWQVAGTWLVIRNVEMLRNNGDVTAVDGEVVVSRDHVDFIQLVNAE
jgi:hypothetical protein